MRAVISVRMASPTKAVVIGGSVGGVSTAVALVNAGCQVTVLERAAAIVATTGAVQLHAVNVYKVLKDCNGLQNTAHFAGAWTGPQDLQGHGRARAAACIRKTQ